MERLPQLGVLAHAVAVAADVDDVAVVKDSVDERRRHDVVPMISPCPKTQTNSRLARRAVSIVIDPWRAPDLGRVGGDVGDSGSPYAHGKQRPARGCHAPGWRPGSRPRAAPGPERASRLRHGSPGLDSGPVPSIYSSARTELDWSPVCRHHAYMIDVFRFDSARRSCQAPRSRSCDGASPVPARTKSRDRYPSCAKTRPFRNRPQISSLDALGIRAESRVFRAAGLTSDPWAGG